MIDHKANVNSAIWLYDKPNPEVKPNVEIDMQEYLRPLKKPKEIHSSFHLWYKEPNSNIALSNVDWNYTVNLDEGYHLYGLERRNGRVAFYIDGIRHWSYNATFLPELVTQPRPLIFNVNGNAGKTG